MDNNMKKIYTISFFAILIIISGFFFLRNKVDAQNSLSPVSGLATITNMGYSISFSGNNGGTFGNIPYNVQYSPTGGFTGYAWSPEYGWIQFNGITATVLSLTQNNDNEFDQNGNPANWATGAISLSGSNGGTSGDIPYSISFNPDGTANATNHWAWGGNVIGWVDFSGVTTLPAGTSLCNFTPAFATILQGDSVDIYWSGNNTTSCVASGGWTGNKPTSGFTNVSPSVTTTYDLTCSGIITSVSCSTTVTVDSYPNCNGGNLIPQIPGTNCGILNCPACLQTPCPSEHILLNGECIDPGTISCTPEQLNDSTELPCYCSIHPTATECVQFCQDNPTLCKKKPKYKEN